MSGVNRNILKNNSSALTADVTPPEVNILTTSGSRWVLIDFLNAVPTSSDGTCTGITLEWSPDPSMLTNPFQPSSSYYSVTSSQFSCASASLAPLTASEAWVQFIDSYWLKTPMTPTGVPTEYFLRARQTRSTNPLSIYSPAVPVQTRAEPYCGEIYTSSAALLNPYIVADLDGYNSPGFTNKWMNDIGDALGPNQSASFAGGVYNVKAGGANYDGLRFDSTSSVRWNQISISAPAIVRCGVGIVRGKAKWEFTSNAVDFAVVVSGDENPTTSSIQITKVATGEIVGQITPQLLPTSLANTYVELIIKNTTDSEIRVDNNTVGSFNLGLFGGGANQSLKNNFLMTFEGPGSGLLPNTAIIRCVTAMIPYDPTVFHCKYGPVGASSYNG